MTGIEKALQAGGWDKWLLGGDKTTGIATSASAMEFLVFAGSETKRIQYADLVSADLYTTSSVETRVGGGFRLGIGVPIGGIGVGFGIPIGSRVKTKEFISQIGIEIVHRDAGDVRVIRLPFYLFDQPPSRSAEGEARKLSTTAASWVEKIISDRRAAPLRVGLAGDDRRYDEPSPALAYQPRHGGQTTHHNLQKETLEQAMASLQRSGWITKLESSNDAFAIVLGRQDTRRGVFGVIAAGAQTTQDVESFLQLATGYDGVTGAVMISQAQHSPQALAAAEERGIEMLCLNVTATKSAFDF